MLADFQKEVYKYPTIIYTRRYTTCKTFVLKKS